MTTLKRRSSDTRHAQFVIGLLRGMGLVSVLMFVFLAGPQLESKLYPVLVDFRGVATRIDDDTLVIDKASVVKQRGCSVIQPWRATTLTTHRQLVAERSMDQVPNWNVARHDPGKIVVKGVATEKVLLWAEHRCHPLWTVESKLGEW